MRDLVRMHPTKLVVRGLPGFLAASLMLACASLPARAQQPGGNIPGEDRAVGIAVVKTPRPYVGTDAELIPVPIFQFRMAPRHPEGR